MGKHEKCNKLEPHWILRTFKQSQLTFSAQE